MKRAIVFVMLAVFLLSGLMATTSANQDLTGIGSDVFDYSTTEETLKSFSGLIGAIATFEGTLQAYSVSENPNVEEQLLLASEELVASAEALDAELIEIYQSLEPDQQSAFLETYYSIDSYFTELDDEVDQLSREVEGLGNLLDGIDLGGAFGGIDF